MIDDINGKIIAALKKDGRRGYASLARDLGVNVATVTKRVEKMLQEDVISIRAVLNPFKLDYSAHALITLDIDLAEADRICAGFVSNRNISLAVTTFGRYDVILLADFPTWEALHDYLTNELPRIEGITRIDAFPVIENKKTHNPLFEHDASLKPAISIDGIDERLIEELAIDGRMNYAELADKVGISPATASRRVDRLQAEDIIRISAIRNPAKMGYLANAYVMLQVSLNQVDTVCSRLAAYPQVHLVMTLMSGFEILVGIHTLNPEMLYKFVAQEIAEIEGVANTETFVCAETKKRSYPLFDLEAAP